MTFSTRLFESSVSRALAPECCAVGTADTLTGYHTHRVILLVFDLCPRRKRDGDRFRPAWRDRPAKLKDFLRGQGVPLHRRDEVALICVEDKVTVNPLECCYCYDLLLSHVSGTAIFVLGVS